jgi:Carboxypeptidase regulatory-like domain
MHSSHTRALLLLAAALTANITAAVAQTTAPPTKPATPAPLVTPPAPPDTTRPQRASLTGIIRDTALRPIGNARVLLLGTPRTAYSDDAGRYRLAAIPAGTYTLRVIRIGYEPQLIANVVVAAGEITTRDAQLTQAVQALSQVTITPGSFTLLDAGTSKLSLTRDALLTAPQLAEDLFRSLNRLPGLSGSDFSAKIRIRNGGVDEQLFTLDGLEIIEPFHLKDFDGALTLLDGEAIGGVSVTTGGFTAAAGNRMAGLVEMQSAQPSTARSRTAIGLSISNLRARSEGTFADGRGNWQVSARAGYLQLLLKLVETDGAPDPRYGDVFAKVQYRVTPNQTLSLHTLVAADRLRINDDDGKLTSSYANNYLWARLQSRFGARVGVNTLASVSGLNWRRDVTDFSRINKVLYERVRINDRRSLGAVSVKQDWTVDATPAVSVLFGGEVRNENADYAYTRNQRALGVTGANVVTLDSQRVNAALAPSGARTSAYGSLRVRPLSSVTVEVGTRADRHAWTQQTTVTPRLNAAWNIAQGTTVRGAWGYYAQAHTLQDLSIVDGDTAFSRAERAEQRIVSLEREFGRGLTTRVEAYQRLITSPRARYFNTDGNSTSALPEGDPDRVRFAPSSAEVRGVEMLAQFDRGGHWRGGATLVFSKATAVIGGRTTPRPYDEPFATTVDAAYRASNGWTMALAFTARAGWPIAPALFVVDTVSPGQYAVARTPASPFFNARLASYQRLDFRATRTWRTSRGNVNVWGDIFNLLNHANQSGAEYSASLASPTRVTVRTTRTDFLGLLPTLGVSWEF